MTQHELISRLKLQPKHGMPIDILAELKVSMANLSPILTAVTDEFVGLNMGLNQIVGNNEKLAEKFQQIATAGLYLELRNKELNKSFGINSKSAALLSSKIQETAETLKVSGEQMQKYARSIRSIVPTVNHLAAQNNKYYIGLARVQQVLTTNLGLTEEQAAKYTGFAAQSGKSADEQLGYQYELAKSVEHATGMQGSFKMMTEGIAELTEDVQLQYGRIPGSLQMGVLKAKTLGLEMTQLSRTADNLLNIEASIGQELEYQLLSGHRLVNDSGKSLTNLYREATLRGNMNEQANTLNEILEKEGETLSTNLFARKQMSELLGMDEAALARALQKKSILESLPGGEALFDQTGDALMEAAIAAGANEEQLKQLIENEDTRTTDQKIEQVLKMMVESGIKAQLVDQAGAVGGAASALLTQAKNVQPAAPGKSSSDIAAFGQAQFAVQTAAQEIADAIIGIFSTVYKPQDSEVVRTANTSTETTGNDVIVPAGSSKALMLGRDRINLQDDDMVIAGTNLGGSGGGGNEKLQSVMLQVGAMIVNAINRKQSDQLFGSGINAPYYG